MPRFDKDDVLEDQRKEQAQEAMLDHIDKNPGITWEQIEFKAKMEGVDEYIDENDDNFLEMIKHRKEHFKEVHDTYQSLLGEES